MLTTPQGWTLIIIGNALGFVFSMVVLAISVFSFPMLVDRHVSAAVAIQTSIRAVAKNPATMTPGGSSSRDSLVGFIPLFFGLAVTLPILGHPPGICTAASSVLRSAEHGLGRILPCGCRASLTDDDHRGRA